MKAQKFQLFFLAALLVTATGSFSAHAAPATAKPVTVKAAAPTGPLPCSHVEVGTVVRLAVGKSTLIRPQSPVARLLLGNPQNAQAAQPSEGAKTDDGRAAPVRMQNNRPGAAELDVLLLGPSEIYLLGKTVGSTNIVLLERGGRCTMMDIVVGVDTTALNASIKELLPGEPGVRVTSAGDSLVISGMVSDAAAIDRIVDISNAYAQNSGLGAAGGGKIINMLEVAAPQQVMLEVKVAEISKSLLDQYGINFSQASANGSTIRFLSGLFGGQGLLAGQVTGVTGATVGLGLIGSMTSGSSTTATTVPSGTATVGGTTTTVPIAAGTNATSLSSDAQKQDGLVKILAEPTVMAISGQEGSFLAGGKIFIPVSSNNGSGGTAITLEEKEFGVSLKFTPTVLSGDRINLKVSPEVSELSTQGVTITSANSSGTSILPSFTTRRAATTVQLKDGQSFAIGGLIKNNVTSSITAFPWLGELPVIGALFRSTSFQNNRTELVFVITPHLVKPLPPDYQLPTDAYVEPSRYEMIMQGKQEGARKDDTQTPGAVPATRASGTDATQGGFEVK